MGLHQDIRIINQMRENVCFWLEFLQELIRVHWHTERLLEAELQINVDAVDGMWFRVCFQGCCLCYQSTSIQVPRVRHFITLMAFGRQHLHNNWFIARYVLGLQNDIANAFSHFQKEHFWELILLAHLDTELSAFLVPSRRPSYDRKMVGNRSRNLGL